MSIKCIVDLGDIEGISDAAINNCYATYLRLQCKDDKIMIHRTDNDLDLAMLLSGTLPLFTDLLPPYSDEGKAIIASNGLFLHIGSENKEIIHEIYISNPSLTFGLIEPVYGCLELGDMDFFISYVILNYTSTNRDRVLSLREKHPDMDIYIRGVGTNEHMRQCVTWEVNGVITNRSKLATEYIQTFA